VLRLLADVLRQEYGGFCDMGGLVED